VNPVAMTGRLILGALAVINTSKLVPVVRKKSKNREDGAARLCDDDNDSLPSAEGSSQINRKSSTSGSWQKRQDSAFQEPDSSKEWMSHCAFAI
jgi:hypothetical protein